ncbi:MAG: cytochrome c biogenesis protein CcsA [Terracidiphilus sp.]|jgi:heme exporter protein C
MRKILFGFFAAVTAALMVWGFQLAVTAPAEMMQGDEYRIIFYHVPSASVAFLFFAISMAGSIGYLALREKNPTGALACDGWAVSGAEVGVVFCTVVLVTGPLWGYRAWGIWWAWDARLTTTLLLWLIYVSYLLLRRFATGPQMHTSSAVLGIFGGIAVPIVYIANRIPGQHPGPVFGGDRGSGMDPVILRPFLWNMVAWLFWGVMVLILRHLLELKQQKAVAREAEQALNA